MTVFRSLIVVLAAGAALIAQVAPHPAAPKAKGKSKVGAPSDVEEAVASFDGVFKAVDRKFVSIQVDSGDIMRMYVTHGTRWVRDGKNVKASNFHEGDPVTAEASRDILMNMVAVKIEAKKPGAKPKPDTDR
ncbi:MAG: hypothetical protein KGN84_07115 [Acidobacteriota bacterium]|nr:hypothetical protein [Acidobacteriota bacterium]